MLSISEPVEMVSHTSTSFYLFKVSFWMHTIIYFMEKICYACKCMVLLRPEKHLDLRTLNVCIHNSFIRDTNYKLIVTRNTYLDDFLPLLFILLNAHDQKPTAIIYRSWQ